ncbi:MAG TPA: methyltransferase domain-containing protein [Paraburkholderia sp.]|uniref:methyltransferase domain-containing protein n=1 Tax=Paraburkholderia sp. TaxID=1926495 RepID=UPI002CEDC551|nr:methyltransferase domain-containing protein [Paraburkholderia sp.]HTR05446.1 methyltransferase domain-containing protein [Paraburkholderia sp.]
MKLIDRACETVREEMDVLREVFANTLAPLPVRDLLEIGCGTADMTRRIADAWPGANIRALEVDRIQLERNQTRNRHNNIRYEHGPAEAIPYPDDCFDAVLMFKSLHHVPTALLDQALDEIFRVLRPGGIAYFAEPVFTGQLNDIIRLFHDEEAVRLAAFEALKRAGAGNRWEFADELHYLAPVRFNDFADFERKTMRVTHSNFGLTDELVNTVRRAFEPHLNTHGATFTRPMRVDVLRKARRIAGLGGRS